MAAPIQFESSKVKNKARQELREARKTILDKAKHEYDKREKRKEDAKKRGEHTWMLPALEQRLEHDDQVQKKAKKKKKKYKKEKKAKHKKKKKHYSSDSSESDSDSEGPVWKEKTIESSAPLDESVTDSTIPPTLERDDWMTSAPSFFPCVSRDELRAKKQQEMEAKKPKEPEVDKLGQHAKELNPYWKDGGTGLPEELSRKASKSADLKSVTPILGGGGVTWLKKAYERCKEEAESDGKDLEEVVAKRYGSVQKLEKMIREAEKSAQKGDDNRRQHVREERSHYDKRGERYRDNRDSYERSRRDERERSARDYGRSSRIGESSSRDRDRLSRDVERSCRDKERSSRDKERSSRDKERSSRDRERSSRDRERSSRDRERSSRDKERSSRDRERSSRDGERSSRDRDRSSTDRERSSRGDYRDYDRENRFTRDECSTRQGRSPDRQKSSGLKSLSGKFRRPDDDSSSHGHSSGLSKLSGKFKKPGEDDSRESRTSSSYTSTSSSRPLWRKAGYSDPIKKIEEKEDCGSCRREKSSSESASSDSSDDSSADDYSVSDESSDAEPPQPEIQPLTEEEKNTIGAKIVKAEIMGNTELAASLKAKLEASRMLGNAPPTKTSLSKKEKDDTVILTRQDRHGNVRPLAKREHENESRKGRRKKQKVTTHDKGGERERYFGDDDKYELQDLVQREKMSTAEDSNAMFARLAGRSIEATDDDHQIDDVFVQRASTKQSDAKQEQRDHMMAVKEHKHLAAAMDKCKWCFENLSKHLIIAIGLKAYLCLPGSQSLADGHCLIIPMQHTQSATSLDEDVWAEIQVFRKGLTRMFLDRDEDCVFIESAMNFNRHPHMVIECIPLDKELGDVAPIYFKKAIQESEAEWSQNQKLVDLSQKDIRKAVPKGFPYFSVDFGLQGGFAHVIEDEKIFPYYFGKEILGGMLDLEPRRWRKPMMEKFEEQRKKVLQFSEWWKDYDWTERIKK